MLNRLWPGIFVHFRATGQGMTLTDKIEADKVNVAWWRLSRHLCSLALGAQTSGAFPFVRPIRLGRQDALCLAGTFFWNRIIGELSRRKTPSHMQRGCNRLSAPDPRWKVWGRLRCGGTEQDRILFWHGFEVTIDLFCYLFSPFTERENKQAILFSSPVSSLAPPFLLPR